MSVWPLLWRRLMAAHWRKKGREGGEEEEDESPLVAPQHDADDH